MNGVKPMFLKKVDPSWPNDDQTFCSIVLTPNPGYTKEEVINHLNQMGAKHLEEIYLDFISADVQKSNLPKLEKLAQVQVKYPYQMRTSQVF